MKKNWFLFLIALIASELRAEINLDVRKLTVQEGLADNMVTCIHKDHHGFLWFGTGEGISRYDGHSVRNFSLFPGSEEVVAIQENSDRFLYLQTWGRLICFDYLREVPLSFVSDTEREIVLDSSDFLLLEDSVLLICRGEQLQQIGLKEGHRICYRKELVRTENEVLGKMCLAPDRSSVYVVSNRGNVHHVSLQTGKIISSVPLFANGSSYLSVASCALYGNYLVHPTFRVIVS